MVAFLFWVISLLGDVEETERDISNATDDVKRKVQAATSNIRERTYSGDLVA